MNMVKKLACGVVCAAVALGAASAWAAGTLPAGYTEVEYIQPSGNARIITDYTPTPNADKIEAVVEFPTLDTTQRAIWCARASFNSSTWTLFVNAGKKFRFDYGNTVSQIADVVLTTDQRYTVTAASNQFSFVSASQSGGYTHTKVNDYTAGGPVVLFSAYYNGTANNVGDWGTHRLYSFKVWRSGKLIHYFVPCKDPNGVATMVDICYNAALDMEGTFTAGSVGHFYDDLIFPENTLAIDGSPEQYGTASPAYGDLTGLEAGDTRAVSCSPTWRNSIGTVYSCTGWKLYDENDVVVSNGTETAFTYTHPTPAAYRRLEWQWELTSLPHGGVTAYVQDGLIACWDGIENAGAGQHDAAATVWKDAIGGYEFTLNGVTVNADRMTFAGSTSSYGTLSAADTTSSFVAAKDGTMEIVYRSDTGAGTQVLLQSTDSSGLAFGIFSGNNIILRSSSSTAAQMLPFTSGANTNCVSVFYTSRVPVSAVVNGGKMALSGSNYWGSPGTTTVIGKRASNASGFLGSIYCIRLYNRHLSDEEIAANYEIDQKRFILRTDESTLQVSSSVEGISSSPSPDYGPVYGLAAGAAVPATCGHTEVTNSNGSVYSCTGWKLYNENDAVVSNGTESAFTYVHPTPAAYRKLEWQWEIKSPPTRYVQDGLIACWDGIENAGAGVHEDNVAVWKSIVGGYEFTLNNVTVDANCMTFAGSTSSYGTLSATDTASTFLAAKSGTLEIVYRSRTGTGSQVIMQSTGAAGMAFSIWETSKILPYTSSSQAAQLSFSFTSGTEVNFAAVRYVSGAPVTAIANGSALSPANASSWASPGSETIIGNRYTKASANSFPGSIYAIRLYDRQLTDSEILANQSIDQQRFSQSVDNSRLVISSTPEGAGRPSPANGYLTGLAAGTNFIVTCGGAITWTNAAETIEYSCAGWRLYDANDSIVDSGNTLSFVYAHPTPAAFRRLEWVWQPSAVKGNVVAGADGSVSPSGTAWYAADTPITVTATPDSGKAFINWTGTLPSGITDTSASATFTPTAPFEMTANFGVGFCVATTGSDDDDGSAEHPFATISNAIEKADAAIAGGAQHVIINAADGSYPENGLVVTNAIVIAGNAADRTAVKIGKSGARVFRIAHADAALKNLTVQNGTVTAVNIAYAGGNVRLENGTVANCVLTGGGNSSITDGKGGNLYIGGGLVVDCLMTSPLVGNGAFGGSAYITGGTVSRCIIEQSPKASGNYTALGAGAYLTGGVIENCLIRDNRCGRGALYLSSSAAKAVNCTIVGNTPEGNVGGVYVNNASASVINCVIFDNGGTELAEWGNNNGARFFNCVSTVENANGVNWTKLPFATRSTYFEDDEFWTPLLGSPMVDAGDDSRYPSTSSQTDIAGNARISGSHIDIGCSELDQSSFNVVATVASYPSVLKGATVDFVCHAAGAAGTVTFELDFGDGSAHLVTTDTQISHRFDVCGLFPTRIRAKDGDGEYGDWETMVVPIRVSEPDIYVSPEGNDANAGTAAAPFLTVARALASLTNVTSACSTDVDGVAIHIAAGTYEENGLPAIGSRVTVEGIASDRTAVKIGKSGARIFRLTDEDAVLRNLTVTNGTVTAADISYAGGNVRLENGTVTNCVLARGSSTVQDGKGLNLYIRNGVAVDSLLTSPLVGSGPLGPGAYIAGGVVSRCIIEKAPAKTSTWLAIGSGAYLKGGVIENCLVRDNHAGKGAIYLDAASARAVNCTVVGNTPDSGVGGGTGGVYVNNASASVVNCVVYNNGGTALAEWANKNPATFYSCAFSADAAFTGANSTVKDLTDAAFRDAANGNYRPKRDGALYNAGDNDRYSSYATSTTDLDGAPRIQGKIIDIGCWEVLTGIGSVYYLR